MKQLVIKSPAKLNLYLRVSKKRLNGYHEIRTLFERINLCDEIRLRLNNSSKINVQCNYPGVPYNRDNLAFRAAELLKKDFSVSSGVDITIKKHIPVGSGLGGGSSNAASTLIGLNRLWRLGLRKGELLRYAKKIGSDVPFFILNYSFALGRGRGDTLKPIDGIKKKLWHILVVPDIEISTQEIYRKWDKYRAYLKKIKRLPVRLNDEINVLVKAIKNIDTKILGEKFSNDLEYLTARTTNRIGQIKKSIKRAGVKVISMSGSGPAIFGILTSRKEAYAVKERLSIQNGWQVFVVKTY